MQARQQLCMMLQGDSCTLNESMSVLQPEAVSRVVAMLILLLASLFWVARLYGWVKLVESRLMHTC